jgi:hypothetical protein
MNGSYDDGLEPDTIGGARLSCIAHHRESAMCASEQFDGDDEGNMGGMIPEIPRYVRTSKPSADQRWAAWVAKGIEHDRRVKDRAILAAAALLTAATVWVAFVLFR